MNKIILISGISKGLGYELGKKCLQEGSIVIGISRSPITDDEVFSGERFIHLQYDLSVSENVDKIINYISNRYKIDMLILNSAIYRNTDDITFVCNLNFTNSIYLLNKILDLNATNHIQTKVVYVSSVTAMLPDANYLYSATKAGHTFAIRGLSYLKKEVTFKIFYLGPFSSKINPRPNFADAAKVADYIYLKSLKKGNKSHYFPRYVYLFKVFYFFPDNLYHFIMKYLKKM